MNRTQLFFDNPLSSFFDLLKSNTAKRQTKARKYLNPANVIGGIFCRPIFTKTQEVAQRKTTKSACKAAMGCCLMKVTSSRLTAPSIAPFHHSIILRDHNARAG